MNKLKFVTISIVISLVSIYAPDLLADGTNPKGEVISSIENIVTSTTIDIDADIESRLTQMSGLVEMKYTAAVKKSIKQYIRYQKGTKNILKRSEMYFPIFDQYLEEEDMPKELKYLAIVESGLKPSARSKAGAVGLWQFMRGTGRMMGLKINGTVDQRRDPNMSTKAAISYLKQLYERFGDWGLVLAAYNSGPGRVSSAIRKANSKNFWDIKKYLPKETRNYVPAFIAVSYMMNYYHLHDIMPLQEETDLVHTSSALIYDKLSLVEISKISGSSIKIIKALNPSYLRGYIPTSKKGNYLILPQEGMVRFLQSLYGEDFINELNQENQPVVWFEMNPIANSSLNRSMILIDKLPILNKSTCNSTKDQPININNLGIRLNRFRGKKVAYYRLKKRESLTDVVRKYKNINLDDLLSWNDFDISNPPRPGMVVKIIEQ